MNAELEQLGERIAEQAAHFDAALHRLLTDVREFDRLGGWHVQGAKSCAHWLAWRVGWDLGTARQRVRVAIALADFPVIDDALRRGEISYSKVRAILRVATPANAEVLLEHARLMTASQLEKLTRGYAHVLRGGEAPNPRDDEQRRYVRRRDTEDGMVKIEAVLHPEEAELIWTMLDHAAAQLTREPGLSTPATTESLAIASLASSAQLPPEPCAPPRDERRGPLPAEDVEERDAAHDERAHEDGSAEPYAAITLAAPHGIRAGVDGGGETDGWGSGDDSAEPHAAFAPVASHGISAGVDTGAETDGRGGDGSAEPPGAIAVAAPNEVRGVCSHQPARTSSVLAKRVAAWRIVCSDGFNGDLREAFGGDVDDATMDLARAVMRSHGSAASSASLREGEADETGHSGSSDWFTGATNEAACTNETTDINVTASASEVAATSPSVCANGVAATSPSVCANGVAATSPSVCASEVAATSPSVRASGVAATSPSVCASGVAATSTAATSSVSGAWDMQGGRDGSAVSAGAGGSAMRSAGATGGVLQRQVDATRRAFNRADALVSVAQRYLRGDQLTRSPIEVMLTVSVDGVRCGRDQETTGPRVGDVSQIGEMGESFISREAARRLACDAAVIDVVEDERGMPMSLGRKRRTISGPLRRALYKRDGMCTYPGCTHRLFLEGHHNKHWVDGGETSLSNACLLCNLHHRFVHEYGYTVDLGPDGRPRFRDPHGREVLVTPARAASAAHGWSRIEEANRSLEITAETPACGWDGRDANYGAIVGHLVRIDGLS